MIFCRAIAAALTGLCALSGTQVLLASGRDSTSVLERVHERLSPANRFTDALYVNPAFMPYAYESSLTTLRLLGKYDQQKEAQVMQLGKGVRYGSFEADSYLHPDEHTTVWGDANYRFGRVMDVQWNETSDFELLYPYVMADSVGGDLSSERYAFSGGYARLNNGFSWGVQGDYRAQIEYRDVDPRPRNVVSDLNLTFGGALDIGTRYTLGFGLHGRAYRQRNGITFYNQQGVPKVYQINGVGMYSVRFSNGMTDLYYNGGSYGANLEFFPRNRRGLYATVGYERFSFKRVLIGVNNLPLNRLIQNTIGSETGWSGRNGKRVWGVKAMVSHCKRTGTEYLYGDASGSSNYPRIGQADLYLNERSQAVLCGLWGLENSEKFSFYAEARTGWRRFESTYLSPERTLRVDKPSAGATLTATSRTNRSLFSAALSADWMGNTNKELSLSGLDITTALGESVVQGYERLSSKQISYGLQIQWNYRFPRDIALQVGITWLHSNWQRSISGDLAQLSCGITF